MGCKICPFNIDNVDTYPCILGKISESITELEFILEKYSYNKKEN